MCGRFTLNASGDLLCDSFGLPHPLPDSARYNIAPSQTLLSVHLDDHGQRRSGALRWGLVPSWAKDASIGARLINARAESVADKPAFRSAFKQRRCLIPATGFYEWQRHQSSKQAFYFQRHDAAPFAIAALWERWPLATGDNSDGHAATPPDPDQPALYSCTLLTTSANATVAEVHQRMPVILPAAAYASWLDPTSDPATLQALLQPLPAALMQAYPVSNHVNRPVNDDPSCIEPLDLRPPSSPQQLSLDV